MSVVAELGRVQKPCRGNSNSVLFVIKKKKTYISRHFNVLIASLLIDRKYLANSTSSIVGAFHI